jgi:23S rRNA (guanine745-N1)-methyltransferase
MIVMNIHASKQKMRRVYLFMHEGDSGFSKSNINQNGSIRKAKFRDNINIFECPICGAKMNIYDLKDITCENGHCFNIARKGYVNFLLKPAKTEYDKEMFHSRNIICASGFFDPILEGISDLILEKIDKSNLKNTKILDAGCGEGSHLGQIINSMRSEDNIDLQGVGIDISKEGILIASKGYFDTVWCVADLANLPFTSKQFDVIINILSPANYGEFARTLKDDGVLIKVVPGSDYLKELRQVLHYGSDKQTYSNDEVLEHYSKNFKILDMQEIVYSRTIDKENLMHLIKMTPLSWTAADDRVKQAFNMKIKNITVDLTIIVGKKAL